MPNPAYVVTYDLGESEQYYGYFSSEEEAERLFSATFGHRADVSNVRICRVVREYPRRTVWVILYLHRDGTEGERFDTYSTEVAARSALQRLQSIHGSYPNGNPRWRLAKCVEVTE